MSNDSSDGWLTSTTTGSGTTGRVSQPMDDVFLPGDMLDDRYEILDILGEGGFGVVYRGRQVDMGRDVAVKTLRRSILDYEEAAMRFRREAMLARHLTHPNTIRLYDFGESSSGILYIVMEYLEGQTLEDRIDNRGAIPMPEVLDIAQQIGKSLTEAHQNGIVHRDLKPSNVFLTALAGENHFVKVLDFGIAKVTQPWDEGWSDKLTRTGTAFGSPAYMSPEQVRGRSITSAADIYAFGLIMLEGLLGRQIIDGNSPFDVALKQASPEPIPIPPWIAKSPMGPLLRKCVEKDYEDRFPSAAELFDELDSIEPQAIHAYLETLTTEVDFEELLLEAYEPPASTDEFDTPGEKGPSRGVIIYSASVVAIVLVALITTMVLSQSKQVPDSQGAVAQNPNPQDQPRRPPASSLAIKHTRASLLGAVAEQLVPRPPLGVDAERLPVPLLPQSSMATPVIVIANAYRMLDAIQLKGPLRNQGLEIDHPVALPVGESALISAFAGSSVMKQARITFDSRPRGATVYRNDTGTALGRTPLELGVTLSAREVTYRVEARGYKPVFLQVWHDRNYDGFAYMRKNRRKKANRFTVPD